MSSECDAVRRRRFDLSMSRRTRKPSSVACSSLDQCAELQKTGDDGFYHVSLKELMKESNGEESDGGGGDDDGRGKPVEATRAAATEEKALALATRQGEGAEGLKMARMVGRCVKVLNHLVKARRGSKKRSAVQLLMK